MRVAFDDEKVVSDAGVMLVATVARRLGIEALAQRLVRLRRERPGAANAGRKVTALLFAMVLGADSIDDTAVLNAGRTRRLLGGWLPAPSTLGTFLRAFTFGHVRQLDKLLDEALTRAWQAGAGPGDGRLVIDVDSFVGEVCGALKQGAGYGYTKLFGYHPILATRADTREALHIRLRTGSANTQRGIDLLDRVRPVHRPAPGRLGDDAVGEVEALVDGRRRQLAYGLLSPANVDFVELCALIGLEMLVGQRPGKHAPERPAKVVEAGAVVAHRRLLDTVAVAVLPVGQELAERPRIRRAPRASLRRLSRVLGARRLRGHAGRRSVGGPLRQERVGLLLGVEARPRLLAGQRVAVHGVGAPAPPLDRARPSGPAPAVRRVCHSRFRVTASEDETELRRRSGSRQSRTDAGRPAATLGPCWTLLTSASNKPGDCSDKVARGLAKWSVLSGSQRRQELPSEREKGAS